MSTNSGDFPPPPWRTWGTMQLGLLPLAHPVPVKHGLTGLLSRRLLTGTIRYLGGDLRYNLFLIASAARHGHHVGAYLRHVWVDDESARQAAVELWGLNCGLATFSLTSERSRIEGDDLSVTFTVGPRIRPRIPTVMPFPCFAIHAGQLQYSYTPVHARARPATMNVQDWPEHLPRLRSRSTILALEMPRFRMTVPPVHPIADLPHAQADSVNG
jgi:hypothetical protein